MVLDASGPLDRFDPLKHIESEIAKTDRSIFGLEIKPYHLRLLGCSKEKFLTHLAGIGFEHFIILDRENKLRKILSSLKAHQSGVFHLKPGTSPKLEKIHVDPQQIRIDRTSKPLLAFLQEYERDMQEFTDLLRKKSTLFLTYERDIERDPYIGYLKICNILNIRPRRKRIPLSKTTPFPIRDLVENHADLQATLRGTPYDWMLEE
jgi:LPS sulfotransferase NodH